MLTEIELNESKSKLEELEKYSKKNYASKTNIFIMNKLDSIIVEEVMCSLSKTSKRLNFQINKIGIHCILHGFIFMNIKNKSWVERAYYLTRTRCGDREPPT